MPNLSRLHQWGRYVPELGDNREQERPFFLRVASGLSMVALRQMEERFRGAMDGLTDTEPAMLAERLAKLLSPVVTFGDEPLSVEGKPIATLAEYLELTMSLAGQAAFLELFDTIRALNTFGARDTLFSGRPSGSMATTSRREETSAQGPQDASAGSGT